MGCLRRLRFSVLPNQQSKWQHAWLANHLDVGKQFQQRQELHQRRIFDDIMQAVERDQEHHYDLVMEVCHTVIHIIQNTNK